MEQPKFKFGDKVREDECEPFEVKFIHWCLSSECYRYSNTSFIRGSREFDLELYHEPLRPKKLYAYQRVVSKGECMFMREELNEIVATLRYLKRDPEYDIEYPEK